MGVGSSESCERLVTRVWIEVWLIFKGSEQLGGVTALLKVQAGIVGKYVADECQKLMGGYAISDFLF